MSDSPSSPRRRRIELWLFAAAIGFALVATLPVLAASDAAVSAFKKADANGDGKLSKDEAAAAGVGDKFAALDVDKDGSLSLEEFAAGM